TFIDKKFLELMDSIAGESAMKKLRDNNYGELQYLVREFCEQIKFQFTEELERDQWEIDITFDSIKAMFDPIIDRIIRMIQAQLYNALTSSFGIARTRKARRSILANKCSAIFLVGGFSQSKYLLNRIKKEFTDSVENISVPTQPAAAICRGAAMYGISMNNANVDPNLATAKFIIGTRVLKYTYGVRVSGVWAESDPPHRKLRSGRIHRFSRLAKRGVEVKIDQEFTGTYLPVEPDSSSLVFYIFITENIDGKYCDEDGMKLLGSLRIDLPDLHLGTERPVQFSLMFGKMEITASAKNMINGQSYHSKFELSLK
ncbi:9038_t:CDS:2, partial [Cetraspora pellucida]